MRKHCEDPALIEASREDLDAMQVKMEELQVSAQEGRVAQEKVNIESNCDGPGLEPPEEERVGQGVLMIKIDADTTAFNEKVDILIAKLTRLHDLWRELNKGE